MGWHAVCRTCDEFEIIEGDDDVPRRYMETPVRFHTAANPDHEVVLREVEGA